MTNDDLKIAVMFFSATGNCKRIATGIASHFKSADLVDITYKLNEKITLPCCDILFVAAPVYSQLCPPPIKKFLKRLQFDGAVVPCVSYGAISAGVALKQIATIFQKKNAKILAAAEIASPHFYYDSGFNEDLLNKEAVVINELYSKTVLRFKEKVYLNKIPVRHFNPLALILPKLRAQIGVKLKPINNLVCAKCHKCHDICPFNCKNHKANRKCLRCGACARLCNQHNKQLTPRPIMHKYLKNHIGKSHSIVF